jgi:glycosyltransferase involved in cell wall biosynthesis
MTAMEKVPGLVPKKGPADERIDIIHFDLAGSSIADIPPGVPGTEVLIIFWRGDIPAGHAHALRSRTGCISPVGLMSHVAPARNNLLPASPSAPKKTLSVIVCTRDRPGALWRCLQSLLQQNSPPDQILVVDNASRDDAAEDIARLFAVDYAREDRAGLDYARNRGIREARGDIVAFVDDDVAVHPAWTERTIAAFDQRAIMAVTGLVLPAELETHPQVVFETQWGFGRGYERIDYWPDFLVATGKHIAPTWRIGAGANMAFRREVFDKIGYFDERLDAGAAGCGGDSEFWYRVLARGWCCRYEPSAVVFHYHRRSERELARQIRAYMRGHVATLLVQNRRYHDRRNLRRVFATLPVWYGRKLFGRLRQGKTEANAFVWQEIAGALAGIPYHLLRPRSREAFPRGQLPLSDPSPEAGEGAALEREADTWDAELVSVIVPAFNAAGTIAETLRSVCDQTYRNLEILVVDDGSTDATRDIVRKIARTDPRIRLIEKTNGGVASARNLGVLESRGEFIAPVDADDLWRPTKIAKQMKAMREIGDACGLVYTWYAQIDNAGRIVSRKHKPLDEGHVLIRMCRGNVVGNGSGALMRKRAMLDAGLYDPALRSRNAQGCEDLKLYFAIAERYLFAVVKEHLTGYRRIDWNMSSDVLQMERSNTIVTAEFQERYPQYGALFRVARITFLKWLFVRAVRLRRPFEVWVLARKIFALDPLAAIKILLMLPITLARGWAVPRAKWLVKWLLRWDTHPVYFIRPASLPGPAPGKMRPRHFAAGILTRLRAIT